MRVALLGLASLVLFAAALSPTTSSQESAAAKPPTAQTPSAKPAEAKVEDLAWIAGSWVDEAADNRAEEHWTGLSAGTMLGMFRLVSGGKLRVSELMLIEQNGPNVAFRFRHFGPGHKPWEPNDKPLVFDLVQLSPTQAVFESSVQTQPKKLVYRKEGEAMAIEVYGEEDGKAQPPLKFLLKAGSLK